MAAVNNESNRLSATARLFNSIRSGDCETVQVLLQEGVNIEVTNSQGFTPALLATALGKKNVAKLLIENGANVDCRENCVNTTMLHHASRHRGTEWLDIVQTILQRKPDLEARDILGLTPLHHAAYNGNVETVRCLVKAGADMDSRNNKARCTPMLMAAERQHREIVQLLLYGGARFDICNRQLRTVWHYAAVYGWLDVIRFLANLIPDLNEEDIMGQTALHLAACSRNVETVQCLVEAGANINAINKAESTPILIAAEIRHREVVQLLLDEGAIIDICNRHLRTVWHYAALNGWLEIVKLVGEKIGDREISDKKGYTALHLASLFRRLETVKYLVEELKVDINARCYVGNTPMLTACQLSYFDIAEYFFQKNACCDVVNVYRRSPLFYLIVKQRPNIELIKLFIEKAPHLLPGEYLALLNNSLLQVDILQDVDICSQVIVNQYNNRDLPELYKLLVAESLPKIERIRILPRTETFRAIERAVRFEIQTKGRCTLIKVHPMVLKAICVESLLNYNDRNMQIGL